MASPRIVVFRDRRRRWRFRVVAANGEICAQSQAYTRKRSAIRAARRLPTIVAAARLPAAQ